ncbi:MAG TPA: SDR family oxidoreductase [Candidatus Salinicoccus stercoripullorum]|uniref:SDR family oxidoreductase n=1 Tax=Candidatus Salinicoccus stercoripullorum TaxID=2838756 RepID=A0A9D1QG93_9STAP|nr:SDR family oxidoreductase [Candidatus Salinicoccus stercoripullorum]
MTILKDKVAIVTGASSGIGAAIAKKLAENGANVILAARNEEKLGQVRKDIGHMDRTLAVKTDMTQRADVEELAEKAASEFGPVDIYVNGAGVMGSSTVIDGDVEDWEIMIDLNIKGVLYGINSVLPGMKERGRGHIINIASDAGYEVIPRCTVYCGTKFAVRAIATGMEKELEQSGVRVTSVSPGMVDTPLSTNSPFEEGRKKLEPEDIANAVVYAATQPDYVNVNEVLVRPV